MRASQLPFSPTTEGTPRLQLAAPARFDVLVVFDTDLISVLVSAISLPTPVIEDQREYLVSRLSNHKLVVRGHWYTKFFELKYKSTLPQLLKGS
jgi:hypothetical protein